MIKHRSNDNFGSESEGSAPLLSRTDCLAIHQGKFLSLTANLNVPELSLLRSRAGFRWIEFTKALVRIRGLSKTTTLEHKG